MGCRFVVLVMLAVMCGLSVATGVLAYKLHQEYEKADVPTTTTPASTKAATPLGTAFNSISGFYKHAAVAADYGPCSTIGTEMMMKKGGSVVDAAIASVICVGATHLHSNGIGGGHFMIIYDRPSGRAESVMAREHAPLAATEDMFVNDTTQAVYGGKAIAVPNELLGYKLAWEKYGRLSWSDLFQPTIELMETGFYVDHSLAYAVNVSWDMLSPSFREMLSKSGSVGLEPIKENDILRRPTFAQTLRTIASEGVDAFYNGSLTDQILAEIQDNGGIITREDFEQARTIAKLMPAVESTFDHLELKAVGPPPPSSGAVVQFILNILDGFKLKPSDIDSDKKTVLTYHRIIEAMKFGFGKRSTLGDSEQVDVSALVAIMTNKSYGEYYRKLINDAYTLPLADYEPNFQLVEDHGTTHLSLIGPDGSAVGITSTINFYFGSKIRGNETGIIYNNEMDDFSTPGLINGFGLVPSPSNFIKPGKRPMSSMSPTIVLDKDSNVVMIAGASGGTRIISATALTLVRSLWLGQDLKSAIDTARFHDQLLPDRTEYEPVAPEYLVAGLRDKGHKMYQNSIGVCQGILVDCKPCINCSKQCISAVSDGRKGGHPDGY